MNKNLFTTKAILLGAAAPLVFAISASAHAQEANPPAPAQDSPAATPVQGAVAATTDDANPESARTSGEDIVVTGSLFRRTDTETPSPVTVLTSETLQRAGVTTVADALRSVSADSAGSIPTGFQGGFSAGGSAVSLRGLGVSSTLILIDGLRSAAFPINDDGHNSYTDLNSIPFSAVDRVEVLKDGASSTYGADAIGGVVNVILKKHFTGVAGTVEGGINQHGYGSRYRANMTAGIGDYDSQGFNFYVNGEYQRDGRISGQDVGFPFNTTDLSSIGLADNNAADSSLTAATTNAVVVRAGQTDPNNPLSGSVTPIPSGVQANGSPFYNYQLLNPNCPGGTYTLTTGTNRGTGCARNLTSDYSQVQPLQEKFSFTGRLSLKINDNVDAYILGSYSHSQVNIIYPGSAPSAIRQRQPYGASPLTASNNPGIVLPVFICAAGTNCATAADRTLNPYNPFAAQGSSARIYYLFGDILTGSNRGNEVIRGAIGFNGHFGDDWDWRVEAVGARDNLKIVQLGTPSIAGLTQAVNTGAYNFINPDLNTDATRQLVAPNILARSYTSLASLDASISKALVQLPGGPLQLAVGGQVRRETLNNPGTNPDLLNYSNTAAAFGAHTVSAGYFELNAPILKQLEINASGRYDHYSEGFSKFSPKIGAKFTPIEQLSIRGTFSKGFRAPTFAESNPRSSYPGFVTYSLPAAFVAAHGGSSNPYTQPYSIGGGFSGNPDLKPETSRSFTGGLVFAPNRIISLTVDYYNVKKSDVIVAGPNAGDARAAYYAQTNLAAATAAVAAIPGYSVGAVDAIDPLFPNALPRVLVINGPYVNAGYFKTQGIDYSATVAVPINDELKFTSRLDVTQVLKFNVDFGDGVVRKYAGTLGPYELSSGAGTPKWRGNWQNTLQLGPLSLTATAYYVSKIRQVAADEESADANGNIDLSCGAAAANLGYNYPSDASLAKYCKIKRFIYADLNATMQVNEDFSFFVNVGNITNERAPIANASYSGINYLPTWHYAGVVGRTFRAGATFAF